MSSYFNPRRTDEPGSGGKILRRRRIAVAAASPYLRPKSPPISENPSFLSSLFSIAGKLLSSVLGASPSSSLPSDTCSEDDDDDNDASNEDVEDDFANDICFNEVEELNPNAMTLVSYALGAQPIPQENEAKLAIEQLLLQETFSRDECIKLTKIIQSRVVDSPTMNESVDVTQQELRDRTGKSGRTSPEDWCSVSQTITSPEAVPYSAYSLSVFSPKISACQAYLPDLRHAAIKEAKKWFEENKLESSSAWDHGPCTLNTAMLPNVIEGEEGSPIHMAKLYMQAQSPLASPMLNSIGFKSPPVINPYKYETPYYLSLSKILNFERKVMPPEKNSIVHSQDPRLQDGGNQM